MKIIGMTLSLLLLAMLPGASASAQWAQHGSKLVGTGAVGGARQGVSVALSADGNTALVGGHSDNSSAGAAWVYTRSGGVWTQQGNKLVGTGAVGIAYQGLSVALSADGNTALVGGYFDNGSAGAVWVYTRSGGVWTQQGNKLVGTGAVGSAYQGYSVALSADGNTAMVGGIGDNVGTGAVWIYTRSGGVWTQQGNKLVGTGAVGSADQGLSVALSADGNTALVGGPYDNASAGAVWFYTRSGSVWTQQGNRVVGTGAVGGAYQGQSVALSADGNTAMVGGIGDNSSAGAAWVYTRSGSAWTQQGSKLVGTGAVGSANQGQSVTLSADGNTALVGGSYDNSVAGAVWFYARSGSVWTQQGNKVIGTGAVGGAYQGQSVALSADGNTAMVGGIGDNSQTGAVWVYTGPRPIIADVSDVPSDQGSKVFVLWTPSGYEAWPQQGVTSYSLYRGVKASMLQKITGGHSSAKTTRDNMTGEIIYWEHAAEVPPHWLAGYSYPVATLSDSTAHGNPRYYFMVSANTTTPSVYVDSAPDSGYSVDNIPPFSVVGSSGASTPGGPVLLSWNKDRNDPDLAGFQVYRSTVKGFIPGSGNELAFVKDTVYTDNAVSTGTIYYYRIAGVDIHDNVGTPSTEVSQKAGTTGVGSDEGEVPSVFALGQNYPNPFNPTTEIRYQVSGNRGGATDVTPSLSRGGSGENPVVSLKIYDLLGREVATLVNGPQSPGIHEVTWNAADVPSGVYLYRLTAGTFSSTKKLVLLR